MLKSRKWIAACYEAHAKRLEDGEGTAIRDECFEYVWDSCWCCGSTSRPLQRCHIVPRSLGGHDGPSNIVPLCGVCHDEMPDVRSADFFWDWLRRQQNPLSPLGLGRYYEACAAGLALAREVTARGEDLDVEGILAAFRWSLSSSVGLHGGQHGQGPYLKPASLEWALLDAVEQSLKSGQLSFEDKLRA